VVGGYFYFIINVSTIVILKTEIISRSRKLVIDLSSLGTLLLWTNYFGRRSQLTDIKL
jgi:hypothetical protein